MLVFAPTLKGLRLNAGRTMVGHTDRGLRAIARRTGLSRARQARLAPPALELDGIRLSTVSTSSSGSRGFSASGGASGFGSILKPLEVLDRGQQLEPAEAREVAVDAADLALEDAVRRDPEVGGLAGHRPAGRDDGVDRLQQREERRRLRRRRPARSATRCPRDTPSGASSAARTAPAPAPRPRGTAATRARHVARLGAVVVALLGRRPDQDAHEAVAQPGKLGGSTPARSTPANVRSSFSPSYGSRSLAGTPRLDQHGCVQHARVEDPVMRERGRP